MKKVAIMQPYFLPYIGYFQLIKAVDEYVIYDDVNFIKSGWINRNRILLNGEPVMINVPMRGASSFKKINEVKVGENKKTILQTIEQAYKKAPSYNEVLPLLNTIVEYESDNLAQFISNSIVKVSEYLQIKTKIILSSDIKKNDNLKGQEKVISICKILNTTEYYNAIGGQELYDKSAFASHQINLRFLKTGNITYKQFNNQFVPDLSILDIMMFNSIEDVKRMLDNYELT